MIRMEHIIEVIGMPGVGVVIERVIAMRVGVIAMIAVGVSMTVEMRRGIRMVAVWRRVRVRDVGVRRRVGVRHVGVRRRVRVRDVGVRRRVRVRDVGVRSLARPVDAALSVCGGVRVRRRRCASLCASECGASVCGGVSVCGASAWSLWSPCGGPRVSRWTSRCSMMLSTCPASPCTSLWGAGVCAEAEGY